MKRSFTRRPSKSPRSADELARLASGLAASGSRAEDAYWENSLGALVQRLLESGDDEALELALDRLYEADMPGYDGLADHVEARAESPRRGESSMLLIAAPILAWSRAPIPSGAIPPETLENLRVHLRAHVLADGARLALADILFGPDQLPRGYAKTFKLAGQLLEAAIEDRNQHLETRRLPKSVDFLADTRYLLAGVSAPAGSALFRWQEADSTRETALAAWKAQGGASFGAILNGCAFELLLPDAYYAAGRKAEREARPFSVRAAVTLLESSLNARPEAIRAVIAPFYGDELEEYRIGFVAADEVVYGVVWPLLSAEDDSMDTVAAIESLLRERGLTNISALDARLPLEYCDDCGAPLFPNADGEPVHAEWPEDTPANAHLH